MNLKELQYLEPKTILDIGANVGGWSSDAKGVWPDAEIFMVEANFECEPFLANLNIPFEICLLADNERPIKYYQRKDGGTSTGDSIYRENTDWYNDENVEIVHRHSKTLGKLLEGRQYDLIKIDTQGSELDILKGGENIIEAAKYIIMEVAVDGVEPYNIGAPTRAEVMDYMTGIGFINQTVLEDIVHPIHRHVIQQDVLFTRK